MQVIKGELLRYQDKNPVKCVSDSDTDDFGTQHQDCR